MSSVVGEGLTATVRVLKSNMFADLDASFSPSPSSAAESIPVAEEDYMMFQNNESSLRYTVGKRGFFDRFLNEKNDDSIVVQQTCPNHVTNKINT